MAVELYSLGFLKACCLRRHLIWDLSIRSEYKPFNFGDRAFLEERIYQVWIIREEKKMKYSRNKQKVRVAAKRTHTHTHNMYTHTHT